MILLKKSNANAGLQLSPRYQIYIVPNIDSIDIYNSHLMQINQ